eukprot:g4072.t1
MNNIQDPLPMKDTVKNEDSNILKAEQVADEEAELGSLDTLVKQAAELGSAEPITRYSAGGVGGSALSGSGGAPGGYLARGGRGSARLAGPSSGGVKAAEKKIINIPPAGYICHRCDQTGHYKQDCPTWADPNWEPPRKRKVIPKGIPLSFMKEVDHTQLEEDDARTVVMMGGKEGVFGVIESNDTQFSARGNRFSAAAFQSKKATKKIRKAMAIPTDMKCGICSNLLSEAVLLPCCCASVCDGCARNALMTSDNDTGVYSCPLCSSQNISPDMLMPNEELRREVEDFKSKAARDGIEIKADAAAAAAANAEANRSLTPTSMDGSNGSGNGVAQQGSALASKHVYYKTRLCMPFIQTGFCQYGVKCQFAHGQSEIRMDVNTGTQNTKSRPGWNRNIVGGSGWGGRGGGGGWGGRGRGWGGRGRGWGGRGRGWGGRGRGWSGPARGGWQQRNGWNGGGWGGPPNDWQYRNNGGWQQRNNGGDWGGPPPPEKQEGGQDQDGGSSRDGDDQSSGNRSRGNSRSRGRGGRSRNGDRHRDRDDRDRPHDSRDRSRSRDERDRSRRDRDRDRPRSRNNSRDRDRPRSRNNSRDRDHDRHRSQKRKDNHSSKVERDNERSRKRRRK